MDSPPLVSVLMTAYNREKYIAEAIESVLASTYKNFELIIVDDCSQDKTVEISASFAKKDSRIKVYQNQQNLGDYPNRNQAAKYATGKYLKYVDADDHINSWGLEVLVSCMERFTDAGWGLCSIDTIKEEPYPIKLAVEDIYRYHFFKKSLFHTSPLSSIITKKAFNELGGFSGKQHLGDFEFWHNLGLNFPVVIMPHGIVWYRNHSEQQSIENKTNPLVNLKYLSSQYNFFKLNSEKIHLNHSEKKEIINKLQKEIFKQYIKFIIKFQFNNFFAFRTMIKNTDTYNFNI